jgi:uncharacterized protein YdaU (DUF1376 family)
MHSWPRFIGDYQRDTLKLTALQIGVYDLLLDAYYASEQPLPLDMTTLKQIARVHHRVTGRALESVLEQYFKKTVGGYVHERAEEVIAWHRAKSDKARAAAEARWSDANASKQDMRTHAKNDADAYAYQYQVNLKTKGTKPASSKARARARDANASPPSAGGGLPPDEADVLDRAKAKTRLDALVAHLRSEGVTDASAVHASVRLWASDPGIDGDVLTEALARLRQRHNVRHPMGLLAKIVADVTDERDYPHAYPTDEHGELRAPRANGQRFEFDERAKDRKRAALALTGGNRRAGDGEVIDLDAKELGDATRAPTNR